jgi:hypothetical protein
MGRIGRSYPRVEEASRIPAEAAEGQGNSAFQSLLGATIGTLCALGLIGWILSR